MSEELQLADPLAALGQVDMSDVDTSMPLLPAALHRVRIDDIQIVPSKKTPGGFNALIIFKTVDACRAHTEDGSEGQILENWSLRSYYPMQHNAKALEELENGADKPTYNYLANFASLADAVQNLNPNDPADRKLRNAFNPQDLLNVEVVAKVAVSEMKDDSGAGTGILSNDIKSLSHPVDA
tara:strand:+ start:40 stop:585 length:546 start_codon:yes stop_codon:yes gene_type:complete